MDLRKIDPQFRQQVDLLFFSDRMDLELSQFKALLRSNYDLHFEYLWDRFQKCSEIAWENGEAFWNNRIVFLFSLNEKALNAFINEYLTDRAFILIRNKKSLNKYNIEYIQHLELCKIRRDRGEDLSEIKDYLIDLQYYIPISKLANIVGAYIPVIFDDMGTYAQLISKKIIGSARSFKLLLELESVGIIFDKLPIAKLAKSILMSTKISDQQIGAFYEMLNDKSVMELFKKEYSVSNRANLVNLISKSDYDVIDEYHLRNVKNLIELDPGIADDIANIYVDKLYQRYVSHKKANVDRLIRLIKVIPQISSKNVLVHLSSIQKTADIKYLMLEFPELKKLSAFV